MGEGANNLYVGKDRHMSDSEKIERVKRIIGQQSSKDYELKAGEHAASLEKEAPSLAAHLRSSELRVAESAYDEADKTANVGRKGFARLATAANWLVFGAACVPAATMAAGTLGAPTTVVVLLGSLAFVLAGIGAAVFFVVRQGQRLRGWLDSRAKAEAYRHRYFVLATEMPQGGDQTPPPELPLALFQLEYFRRYQLEMQISFFREKGRKFRKAFDRWTMVGGVGAGLGIVANGLAAIFSGTFSHQWAALASVAVVAVAMTSLSSSTEGLFRFGTLRDSYAQTKEALETVCGRTDEVAQAVLAQGRAPLQQLVGAVHEILSVENKQWIKIASGAATAVAKLEQTLDERKNTFALQQS